MSPIKLHAVPASAQEPLDIGRLIRADILARDWERCHIEGERNPPLPFFERIKRAGWR